MRGYKYIGRRAILIISSRCTCIRPVGTRPVAHPVFQRFLNSGHVLFDRPTTFCSRGTAHLERPLSGVSSRAPVHGSVRAHTFFQPTPGGFVGQCWLFIINTAFLKPLLPPIQLLLFASVAGPGHLFNKQGLQKYIYNVIY